MNTWVSYLLLVIVNIVITACASDNANVDIVIKTNIPTIRQEKADINDACDIYDKNPEWLVASLQASQKWQVPLFTMLAIVHQESRFVADARPLNSDANSNKKYASSAYGYSQALDNTWKEYQQKTGNTNYRRDNFGHSVDFIGWYTETVHKKTGISKWATDRIYLNYHEGIGGYKRNTHKKKPWLLKVATKVKRKGVQYAKQLKSCGIPLYLKSNGKFPKKKTTAMNDNLENLLRSKGIWF